MVIMKRAIYVLFIMVAASAAQHDEEFNESIDMSRSGLEETVKQVIEQIREKLREGIPDMGIPPMDPLDLKFKNIDIELENTLKIHAVLKEVKGNNILSFNTTHLKASVFPISFELGFRWEPIDMKGHYHIDGHLLNIIPIYGNGPFEGRLDGAYVYGKIDIGTKAGQLYVKKLDLNFGIKEIKVNIKNFLGSTLGDVICEIINENVPTWIEQFKIGYLPGIKDAIVKEINNFLKDKTVDELLEFIQGLLTTTAAPDTTSPAVISL